VRNRGNDKASGAPLRIRRQNVHRHRLSARAPDGQLTLSMPTRCRATLATDTPFPGRGPVTGTNGRCSKVMSKDGSLPRSPRRQAPSWKALRLHAGLFMSSRRDGAPPPSQPHQSWRTCRCGCCAGHRRRCPEPSPSCSRRTWHGQQWKKPGDLVLQNCLLYRL
jgi:hypothetical protein